MEVSAKFGTVNLGPKLKVKQKSRVCAHVDWESLLKTKAKAGILLLIKSIVAIAKEVCSKF